MKKLITSLALTICSINIALASNWQFFSIDTQNNIYSYDKSSVKKNGEIIKLWISSTQKDDSENVLPKNKADKANIDFIKSMMIMKKTSLVEISCKQQKSRTLKVIGVYGDGRTISNDNPSNWSYFAPDTIMEALHNEVCK